MLRPIGSSTLAGPDGRLPRLGRPPTGPHAALADRLSAQVAREVGVDLVAVVLRGSAARGTAVLGASDLDLVVVRHACAEAPVSTPTGTEVEVSAMTQAELVRGRGAAWMRFALSHSGWTVHGRDVVAELPDPVLGPHCVAHLRGVERWGSAWPSMLAADPDDAERRLTCRWLMKRIVRSAFETVMLEVGGYTRDLHPCAAAAAEHHPDRADLIWRAAERAVAPTGDRAAIAAIAAPSVTWLRAERTAFLARQRGRGA